MSELPTPVSESTAIEVVRQEGMARSFKSVSTLTAGDICYFANNSGIVQVIAGVSRLEHVGAALYDAASGNRATTIRGKIRARWDGTGTPGLSVPIGSSATRSGWWEVSADTSGVFAIGQYLDVSVPNPGATNSGTLLVVELF